MKCPDCNSIKLDFDVIRVYGGLTLFCYCTKCDWQGSTYVEETKFTEDKANEQN